MNITLILNGHSGTRLCAMIVVTLVAKIEISMFENLKTHAFATVRLRELANEINEECAVEISVQMS